MNINDLSYLGTVSETTNILGGRRRRRHRGGSAKATADAAADALGKYTRTDAYVETNAAAGIGSSSYASSTSYASNGRRRRRR
ncbi:hypothetical protein QGP82_12315 [Leptothoe sp. LEGE 181152]|nr:hypothetical protein [Leptothoe sp. LEGE 181152]